MRKLILVGSSFVAATSIAMAQQPSHYAGQQHRDIKALSPQDTQDYVHGKGMGYAKAAELNGYPGPLHVLELAKQLGLSAEQRDAVAKLKSSHHAEAEALGLKRVESERALDALFRSGKATEAEVAAAVRHAGMLEGEYRLSHLETHRRTRALLTDEQVARYDALRGYSTRQ